MTETSPIVTEVISSYPDLVAVLFGASNSQEQTEKLRGLEHEERQKLVRQAYRRRAVYCHPDKCRDPRGPQAFNNLKRAQEVLLDDQLSVMFLADRGSVHDRFAATEGFENMMQNTGGNMHFGYFLIGVSILAAEKIALLCYKMFCPSSFLRKVNTTASKQSSGGGPGSGFAWMNKEKENLRKVIVNEEEYQKLLEKRRKKQQENPYYAHNANVDTGLLSAEDEELFGIFSILKRVVRWDRIVRLVGLLCIILSLVIGTSLHLSTSGPGPSGRNGCTIVELVNRGSKCFNYEESDGSTVRRESGLRRVKLTISKEVEEIFGDESSLPLMSKKKSYSYSYFPGSSFVVDDEKVDAGDVTENENDETGNHQQHQQPHNITSQEWKTFVQQQMEKRLKNNKKISANSDKTKSTKKETIHVGCRLSVPSTDGENNNNEDDSLCSPILTKLAYHHYLGKQQIKEAWKMRKQALSK